MQRVSAIAVLVLLTATPLSAQKREVVVSLYGGGADHLADVQESPPAWFMPGYSLGASVGLQLKRTFAVKADLTYTRNPVEGNGSLASGGDVNRFYYGVHAEYRRFMNQWAPYVFGGLGAVSIDQLGAEAFDPTTRPALMFGGGVFYTVSGSPWQITGEVRGLTYNWNMAGFDRNMLDVTYTVGVAYRFGL